MTVEPQTGQDASGARERVFESALKLFSEKGYSGASIREIIESAGVTRPVLYYYFKSKEDLFVKLVEYHFERSIKCMDRALAAATSCRERLRALMREGFDRAEESPQAVRLLLQVLFAPPKDGLAIDLDALVQKRFDKVTAIMRDGIASGALGGGDPETLALVFDGILNFHVIGKCHRPRVHLTHEFADRLVELFMTGARPAEHPTPYPRSPFAEDAES